MSSPLPASILMDARTIRPGMTGVGRYAYNLLAALARHPGAPPVRGLFFGEGLEIARRDPALSNVELVEAPFSHEDHPRGDLWLSSGARKLVKPGEIWHGPAFIIPGGRRSFRRAVSIHDLFVFNQPSAYPAGFRVWLRWAIRRACRGADRIIVPSRAVAAEIARRKLAPESKIAAIHLAPDTTPAIWEPKKGMLKGGDLFAKDGDGARLLTIGALDARKDPQTARTALMLLGKHHPEMKIDWLWAGGGAESDPTPQALVSKAAALGFRAPGHCAGEALRAAMKRATAYVTCSRAEGFGIPLAEAMEAGCPIVASDIPVHREVAGDGAIYFKPGDPAAMAEALAKIVGDAGLRKGLRELGGFRAPAFAWKTAAEKTLEAYRLSE